MFVSYSHDDEVHRAKALKFTQALRDFGIDAWLDRFVENSPPASWPAWMFAEIRQANFVVLVCTETYKRRVEDEETPGKGLGARWEGAIITHDVYNQARLASTSQHVPVVFTADDLKHVPFFVAGASYYVVDPDSREGLEKLIRRFKGQPEIVPAPLGSAEIGQPKTTAPKKAAARPDSVTQKLLEHLAKSTEVVNLQDVTIRQGRNRGTRIYPINEETGFIDLTTEPHPVGLAVASRAAKDDALALVLERSLFDALAAAPRFAYESDLLLLAIRSVLDAYVSIANETGHAAMAELWVVQQSKEPNLAGCLAATHGVAYPRLSAEEDPLELLNSLVVMGKERFPTHPQATSAVLVSPRSKAVLGFLVLRTSEGQEVVSNVFLTSIQRHLAARLGVILAAATEKGRWFFPGP